MMPEETNEQRQSRTRRRPKKGVCATCQQERSLTFHHLIPKKLHRRNHFKRSYSKEALSQGVYVCRPCHDGIHRLFDEMTLAKQFASLSALLADESLGRHFGWVAKQRRQF
jgi:5-methylcytosine-specific restriction endonuclease McrA